MRYNHVIIYIHRFLSGEMDKTEESDFNKWVNSDEQNKKLFSDISTIWSASSNFPAEKFDAKKAFLKHKLRLEDEAAALKSIDNHSENIKKPQPKIFYIRPLIAIAASLILVLAAWFIVSENSGNTYDSKVSLIASLDDGSRVWMKDGAKIEFKEKSNKRLVELNGKAYFEVAKDDKKPFTVVADGMEVKVVGTMFTVDSKEKSVFVKEGVVDVYFKGNTKRVEANQKVNVLQGRLSEVNDLDFYTTAFWINDNLTFNKTPFDIVINDISEYFGVKFDIPQGRDWSNCTFTSGSLKSNSLDDIITTLKLTYELDCVKINDKNYKISKVKCK